MKYVPNILTVSRFIFIPFIIHTLVNDIYLAAFILLTISSLTDILDGIIARKGNYVSDFGKLIDPLADKATQLSILITLTVKGIIPIWIIIIMILKEIIMIIGASFLYGKDLVVSSKWYGKLTTVLIYLSIVSSFALRIFDIPFLFDKYLYVLAVGFAIFSLVMYFIAFYKKGYINKQDIHKENIEIK